LVSFHAHPDDEALLTGGTLAKAAAEGHRVVLVVATYGEAGLAASPLRSDLRKRRRAELATAAAALGCARVEWLGYADSGMHAEASAETGAFARADVEAAAKRLAEVLTEERADALTVYDSRGGYGHPDHVQVHRVGLRAAQLAGTPVVLEATVDGDALRRAVRLLEWLPRLPEGFSRSALGSAYTAPSRLTHQIDVRRFAAAKRAALAAHETQTTADEGSRTLSILLRLPKALFRRALGREWFVERGRTPQRPLLDDIFVSLRGAR
jgi:LmbE family N-acetylglucosaminyl deacetylase